MNHEILSTFKRQKNRAEKNLFSIFFHLNKIHFPTKSKMDAFTDDGGITSKNTRSRSNANSFIRTGTNKTLRVLLYFLYSKA